VTQRPSPFSLAGGSASLEGRTVLSDVDFELAQGEFLALLGPNGSGKTTLVRALLGLLPLDAGTLSLFGAPLGSFREWARIGYVPQRFTAVSGVPASVGEVVLTGRIARARRLRPYGRADKLAAATALEEVGIGGLADRPVGMLSGGQQQRVLIARALAGEPDVLVLDEPVASVDLEQQESFAATLTALSGTGRSFLLVAHALGPLQRLVDRAVVLQGGRVVYDGRPFEPTHEEMHIHPHHPEPMQAHDPFGGSEKP
jgi:zinc transport system ATP-binding protein